MTVALGVQAKPYWDIRTLNEFFRNELQFRNADPGYPGEPASLSYR
jgi:hypothetical protein